MSAGTAPARARLQRGPRARRGHRGTAPKIRDEGDPYRYAEVRGRVDRTTTGPEARKHIDEVAHQYLGSDYPPDGIKSERVILWVTPERQTIIDQNKDTSD